MTPRQGNLSPTLKAGVAATDGCCFTCTDAPLPPIRFLRRIRYQIAGPRDAISLGPWSSNAEGFSRCKNRLRSLECRAAYPAPMGSKHFGISSRAAILPGGLCPKSGCPATFIFTPKKISAVKVTPNSGHWSLVAGLMKRSVRSLKRCVHAMTLRINCFLR